MNSVLVSRPQTCFPCPPILVPVASRVFSFIESWHISGTASEAASSCPWSCLPQVTLFSCSLSTCRTRSSQVASGTFSERLSTKEGPKLTCCYLSRLKVSIIRGLAMAHQGLQLLCRTQESVLTLPPTGSCPI